MKNNVSSKFPILRKDIFRFAPLWGIYLIGGLLVMLSSMDILGGDYNAVRLASTMGPFGILNMIYAGLVALTLFGDLYNTRLCYALHAMPMRRETWFLTHVTSGLLYSVVPHLIFTVCVLSVLGQFWFVAWAWLLSMLLQYLFFFGLAVLCALCAGNRFAALATYVIANFASLIAYWFIETLYAPFLYGIMIPDKPFFLFSPVVQMVMNNDLLKLEEEWVESWYGQSRYVVTYGGIGEGWGYLAICAGLGIVLMGIALLLYRKRKLESAGDFIAVKPLEPVFAVVFTLCVGCFFALFGSIFGTGGLVFFGVGLILGWFGGQMLLQRTVKVFKGKAFLKLGALILAMALSLGLTAWDPLGITTFVPDADQIERVEVGRGISMYSIGENYGLYDPKIDTTNENTIEEVTALHRQILADGEKYGSGSRYTIRYTLKSGRQVTRGYTVYRETKSWDMLAALFNNSQQILGFAEKQAFMDTIHELSINGYTIEDLVATYNTKFGDDPNAEEYDPAKVRQELKEAMWADCSAGSMNSDFYEDKYSDYYINAQWYSGKQTVYRDWSITSRMAHCQAWLEKYVQLLKAV